MNNPPASLVLAAHLALLSSISFGGFPTVLPDVHNFVAANGWVTDREFADFFAISQIVPGPNMILMMSFIGLKVGSTGCGSQRAGDLRTALSDLLHRLPSVGPVPRSTVAAGGTPRPCAVDDRARHRRWLSDGSSRGYRVTECVGYGGCNRRDARDAPQSAVDSSGRGNIGRTRLRVMCDKSC
jgi:hypothetical protein